MNDPEPEAQKVTQAVEPVNWWHRKHTWTTWDSPFGEGSALASAFVGSSPPWWQERTCTVCKRVDRARVDRYI